MHNFASAAALTRKSANKINRYQSPLGNEITVAMLLEARSAALTRQLRVASLPRERENSAALPFQLGKRYGDASRVKKSQGWRRRTPSACPYQRPNQGS